MIDVAAGLDFLQTYREKRVALIPHPDADGLGGAAVLWHLLNAPQILCPEKGISIHTEVFRERVQHATPDAVIIIDQGSRTGALFPGIPTLIIDHHAPSGIPEGVYITSYPRVPGESAAHLCFLLAREQEEFLWLAAVGEIGDFGIRAPFPLIETAKSRYTQTALLETAALINSARRSSRYDWPTAFHALILANDPRQIATLDLPEARQLQSDREEVAREVQHARKTRPFFADPWAIIPFSSPCLIHGLVASSWLNRLQDHYVVAANFGYRPGYVHFSVRSALPVNLVTALRDLVPEGLPGEWGHGHHGATGGAIAHKDFLLLLNRMGFTPEQTLSIDYTAQKSR